eukprot:GHVS01102012.1.p1 GENE.GHVS01102012.1~~GHVS01102012.1.p1  ORF type:complete len:168 (-),score=13.68 GHVS01102012.1:204-707(-)
MEERRSLSLQMNTLKKATQVLQRDPQIASLNLDKIDDSFDSDLKQSMQKPERAEVTNGVSHALPQAQGNATIITASPSSSPARSPDPRKTSSGGLFDKPLPPTPAGSQKHLFEKEPAKRQPNVGPVAFCLTLLHSFSPSVATTSFSSKRQRADEGDASAGVEKKSRH